MHELPPFSLNDLKEAEQTEVRAWWSALAERERGLLAAAFDASWDECSFGFFAEANLAPLPKVRTCSFQAAWRLSHQDTALLEDWDRELREYLWEHPDVQVASLFDDIHINSRSKFYGMHYFDISVPIGHQSVEMHIWADWTRIRRAPWLLPPSELID